MNLSKREFYKTMLDKDVKDMVKIGAYTGYLCCGVGLIGNLVLKYVFNDIVSLFFMLDVVMFLVLAAGVHLLRSRICAVTMMVYYLLGQAINIYTRFQEGTESTIATSIWFVFAVVTGISAAVKGTFQFHKAWKQYQAGQYVPKPPKRKRSLSELARIQSDAEEYPNAVETSKVDEVSHETGDDRVYSDHNNLK